MKMYEIIRKGTFYMSLEDAKAGINPQENRYRDMEFDKVIGAFTIKSEAEKELPTTYYETLPDGVMRLDYTISKMEMAIEFQFEAADHNYRACNVLSARTTYGTYYARVIIPDENMEYDDDGYHIIPDVSEDYGYLTLKKALLEQMTEAEKESAVFPYDGQEQYLAADADAEGEDITVEIERRGDDIFDFFEIVRIVR